jgi:hypothetical protein
MVLRARALLKLDRAKGRMREKARYRSVDDWMLIFCSNRRGRSQRPRPIASHESVARRRRLGYCVCLAYMKHRLSALHPGSQETGDNAIAAFLPT